MNINEFLKWEELSKDTIDVKRIYIDIADDLVAGILLSQIIFWCLPSKRGKTKLRIKKDECLWLAKGREDWWEECRITPKQFDRASQILSDKGLIEKKIFKFNGNPTIHIRLIPENLMEGVNSFFTKGEKPNYPKVKNDIDERGNSLITENTTENTIIDQHTVENHDREYKEINSSQSIKEDTELLIAVGDDFVKNMNLGHLAEKSKRKEKLEQKFKEKNIPALIKNWDQERVMIREKIGKGGAKVKTSPRNSNSIIAQHRELFKEFFGGIAPLEGKKDLALVKKMIDHYGYDFVYEMINWVYHNWAIFVREKDIKGVPTIGLIWGFRSYIQSKVTYYDKLDSESEW
jgi:hypothetical protein